MDQKKLRGKVWIRFLMYKLIFLSTKQFFCWGLYDVHLNIYALSPSIAFVIIYFAYCWIVFVYYLMFVCPFWFALCWWKNATSDQAALPKSIGYIRHDQHLSKHRNWLVSGWTDWILDFLCPGNDRCHCMAKPATVDAHPLRMSLPVFPTPWQ